MCGVVLVILSINVPYDAGHLARIAATMLVSCLFDSESCVHGGLILSINVPYNAGHLERIAATVQVFGARMHCLTWGLAGGELAMRRRGCRGPCSSLLFRVTFQLFEFAFFLCSLCLKSSGSCVLQCGHGFRQPCRQLSV